MLANVCVAAGDIQYIRVIIVNVINITISSSVGAAVDNAKSHFIRVQCIATTVHTFSSYFSYKLNFHIEIIQYVWDVTI